MVAMGTGRAAQCLGVVLTVMAAGSHLTQGAPAYSTRPVRAPPCPHATHTSLCWTVRLKSPLHFHLTPAADEGPLPPQDSAHPAGSTVDGHFYPKTSPLTNQPSPLTNQPSPLTNQPSPLTNQSSPLTNQPSPLTNQSGLSQHDYDFSFKSDPSFFKGSSSDSGTSSSSGLSDSPLSSSVAAQENDGKNVSVTSSRRNISSSPGSPLVDHPQPAKSNSGALLSEKVGHGSARSADPAHPAGTEVSRSQKAYVYHQMALQLADEVGLSLLGKVGELYDHFVLCHEDREPDADTRSRHANPDSFRESGKAFQSYHKAHADLLKEDAATYDEIRNQAEGSLHRHPDVAWFSMETVHHRQKRAVVFNDPAFPNQWHLVNHVERGMDINVTGVWERGVTGKGVTVAVVDDGLEWTNPDLHSNYNFMGSWDLNDNDPDPMPKGDKVSNHHGTRCAGEIAAVPNNQVCGVGVAYGSKVSGIRVLDGPMTDSLEAEAFNKKFDINAIYSCSWGPDDDGKTVDGPHILAAKAMKYGIEFGRHGYGSIFVVASGNGGSKQDNCNYDGYANSIYTVTIGAVDESGAMPFYAEECASMLGVTFSSGIASKRDIVTTDWRQKGSTGCTERHTGTSASAPLAAAMIALMLEVQPCLTWRDVQYIVIITSVKIDRDLAHWHKNAAGLEHSHKHGFGLISAWRMVNAARVWRSVPWMTSYSEEETGDWSIPRGPSNHLIVSHTVTVKDIAGYSLYMLEYVQLTLTLTHPFRGKLDIRLRCPSGTESVIGANRPLDNSTEGFKDWTFTSVRCWGEAPTGVWKLNITDSLPADSVLPRGHLSKWRLTLFGTPMIPQEFLSRRQEVERAMSGEFLGNNVTPPCDPPPVTSPPYIPFSEKTLKILFLASVFCVVFALYETVEYMLCYGEEKRQQAEDEQRTRSQRPSAPQFTAPETTRLLADTTDQDSQWLRNMQSAFSEDEEDDMFLLDAGIATQMRQTRGPRRQNGPAGERIRLSTFRTLSGQRAANHSEGDIPDLSEDIPSEASGGHFAIGASQTPSGFPNSVDVVTSGLPDPPTHNRVAVETHTAGKPSRQRPAKNSILPEMWRALTQDGDSDSDSQDDLFTRPSDASTALLHSGSRRPFR